MGNQEKPGRRTLRAAHQIDRLPQLGAKGAYLKQQVREKLADHKQYVRRCGEDMAEIRGWKRSQVTPLEMR